MITINLPNGSPMSLRGFATMIIGDTISEQKLITEEDRDFIAQCCYINLVLAGGSEEYRNDITSFLFKINLATDTIGFFIEKETAGTYNQIAILNGSTYGTLYTAGSLANPLLIGFKLNWSDVLAGFGEGNYRIRADRVTLFGSDSILSVNYQLKTYTPELADNTILMEWIQDGQIINGLDYTDINWYQSIRLPGFFGERQKEFEEEIWKDSNYRSFQIRNELTFSYKCEIGIIPSCIGNILDNLLQGNTILVTDYNQRNFDYNIIQKPIRLSEISETKYDNNRQAVYSLTFSDRIDNHIKINC